MGLIRKKEPGQAWETESSSSRIGPISVEVTTDPDTFIGVSEVFDLGEGGVLAPVRVSITNIAFDGDGETFGGEGGGNVDAGWIYYVSADGVNFASLFGIAGITSFLIGVSPPDVNPDNPDQILAVGSSSERSTLIHRYVKFEAHIDYWDTGDVYDGPNHPVMTVRFDLVGLP